MGTVSFVAAYSLQPGTTSVGMGDPGSGRIGDLHVLVAALKNPSAGDPTANNGFQLVGVGTVGTGADGAGVGQIRIGVFVREKDVAPSLGTTTLSNGSANVIQGSGAVFRRDNPGTFWRVTCLFGSDTVSDTTFSATVSDIFNAGAGDMVHLSNYFSAGVTPSTRGATFTGLTGTLTGIDSGSTANGNDLGVFTDRFAVTGGSLTAASVTTGSTAAATTGGVVHVLVEAVNAAGVTPPDTYLPDASLFNQADDTGDPALGYLYQPSPLQTEEVVAPGTSVPTENAAATASANDPTAKVSPGSQVASATATANQPGPSVKPGAENAAATATAQQPTATVKTGSQVASATATAQTPSPDVKTNAGNAAATATAHNPTVTVGTAAPAGNASATATANQPTSSVQTGAQNASVTAVANTTTSKVSPGVESAPVSAAANQPTIVTGSFTFANAQNAAVTASANGTTSKVSTGAQVASVASVANTPSLSVRASAALAVATATANNGTGRISPTAGFAAVTVTARDPGGRVLVGAGIAAVGAAAGDITSVVPPAFTNLSSKAVGPRYSSSSAAKTSGSSGDPRYSSRPSSGLSAKPSDERFEAT